MNLRVTLLLPTWNRVEFTRTVLENLIATTPAAHVNEMLMIDAGSEDGTAEYLKTAEEKLTAFNAKFFTNPERHVVSTMKMAARMASCEWIAKIDSDTIVPPGWLEACIGIVERHPEVWALGIEPATNPGPIPPEGHRYARTRYVGGIGLFRKQAWEQIVPGSHCYAGWPEHQTQMPWVKGWVHPPIKVFLLDRLPFEPFKGLKLSYVKRGWQRISSPYPERAADQWAWKFPDWQAAPPVKEVSGDGC